MFSEKTAGRIEKFLYIVEKAFPCVIGGLVVLILVVIF